MDISQIAVDRMINIAKRFTSVSNIVVPSNNAIYGNEQINLFKTGTLF
jgi:hypothetical protein